MMRMLQRMFHTRPQETYQNPLNPPEPLRADLTQNLQAIRAAYGGSDDLSVRPIKADAHSFACVSLDNMVDKQLLNKALLERLQTTRLKREPEQCFLQVEREISTAPEQKRVVNLDQIYELLASGFAVILLDGFPQGLALGLQDFPARSVEAPENEVMERAAHESFVEVLTQNVTMLRRRLKTPNLSVTALTVGARSKTKVFVCYLRDTADAETVAQIKRKLRGIEIDSVLESGYIQPFLEANSLSLFPSVGISERPDTVCAKLCEGRVAVLVDGTPFCLITPYLFSEHFQSMDDYTMNPYYATFIRFLKYLSFFLSFLLPGFYVAIGEHNPEVFPSEIFFKVVDAEMSTPFSLLWEAMIIHIIYEIMREAGLRLPKSIGHAVSIVGALVIGEAAVTAGLIGAPMIIVVAVTALASYVIPSLYYPAAVLRFAFIIVGGIAGLFGVVLLFAAVLVQIASLESYGIPISSPISPFDVSATRDTLIRAGWKTLARHTMKVQNLHGTDRDRP